MKNFKKILFSCLLVLTSGSLLAQFPYTDNVKVFVDDFSNKSGSNILQYSGSVVPAGTRSNYVLTSTSGVTNTIADRFGNTDRAFSFESTTETLSFYDNSASSYDIGFFGSGTDGTQLNQFTISCWVYINVDDTDRRYIFSGSGDTGLAKKLGFGLSTDNKQLFLTNYVNNSGTGDDNATWGKGNKIGVNLKDDASIGKSYEARFYGPALFSAGTGWYHIILVQAEYYTKVFIGTPPDPDNPGTGRIGYMGTSFAGSMIMRGRQDLTPFTRWDLGKPSAAVTNHVSLPSSQNNFRPVRRLSDFTVYDYDMTDAEAEMLYSCQVSNSSLDCLRQDANLSSAPVEQTFAIIGDYGCHGGQLPADIQGIHIANPMSHVADMVQGWSPDYIISLGDDNYATKQNKSCSNSIYDNVDKYYGASASTTNSDWTDYVSANKFYPTLGNQDIRCPSGVTADADGFCSSIWKDYFPDPGHQSWQHLYYKFSMGNIDFFVLNTTALTNESFSHWPAEYYMDVDGTHGFDAIEEQTSVQLQWLKTALEESTATFKVLYTHVPPRASGFNTATDDAKDLEAALKKWPFDIWGVDVVISGDHHLYERTEYKGVTYVTCGTGGYPGLSLESDIDSELAISGSTLITQKFGALKVETSLDVLKFEYYTINDGETVLADPQLSDEFFIYRPAATVEEPFRKYWENSASLDVYLMIGDAAMAGRGPIESSDLLQSDHAFLLNSSNKFEVAMNSRSTSTGGFNRYSNIRNVSDPQLLGPGYTFALNLAKYNRNTDGNAVGLVVNAKSESTVETWSENYATSGDNIFTQTTDRLDAALGTYSKAELKGIIWLGGMSDIIGSTDASTFKSKMKDLITSLKSKYTDTNIYLSELGFGIWTHGNNSYNSDSYNQAYQELAEENENVYTISSSHLAINASGDNAGNYTSQSQRELGIRLVDRVISPEMMFAIIGDEGWGEWSGYPDTNPTHAKDVAQKVKAANPLFIVGLGDDNYADTQIHGMTDESNLVENGGTWLEMWPPNPGAKIDDNVGQYYHEYLYPYSGAYGSSSPTGRNQFFSVMGNHDFNLRTDDSNNPVQPSNGVEEWLNFMPTEALYDADAANPADAQGRYYSYVKGNIEFFALFNADPADPANLSNVNTNEQYRWLQAALTSSTAKFKIVYMHIPPYTSSPKDGVSYTDYRLPFKDWGASIVLSGDIHNYERLEVTTQDNSGLDQTLTYVICGTGGNPVLQSLNQGNLPDNVVQKRGREEYGSMKIYEVDNHLTFKFIDTKGNTQDNFDLYKDGRVVDQNWKDNEIDIGQPQYNQTDLETVLISGIAVMATTVGVVIADFSYGLYKGFKEVQYRGLNGDIRGNRLRPATWGRKVGAWCKGR